MKKYTELSMGLSQLPLSPKTQTLENASSLSAGRWLLIATLLASCFAVSIDLVDPDLWGHVQYGRDVLAAGQIAPTATYTFTAEGYRWINHENLAEIFLATVEYWGGPRGLLALKVLLSGLLFAGIAAYGRRQQATALSIGLLMLGVALNLGYFWSLRPQLFSFMYYAALLGLLNYSFAGWRDQWHLRRTTDDEWTRWQSEKIRPIAYNLRRLRFLWAAPVLFCLWANTHGAFVAGICIYLAYLSFRSLEAYVRLGAASYGLIRRFGLMMFVAVLATIVNPYGPRLHIWLVESLAVPRPEVMEWARMHFWDDVGIRFLVVAGVVGFSAFLTARPKDFTQWAILTITLFQAWSVHRHIPFFVIAAGLWMPAHLDSALSRLKAWWRKPSAELPSAELPSADLPSAVKPSDRASLILYVLASVVLAFALVGKMVSIKVPKHEYPVDAFQYMADQRLNGKMVVSFNWAQYAIAAFAVSDSSPSSNKANDNRNSGQSALGQLSFDGRYDTCYPQNVIDFHFDFLSGDASDRGRCRGKFSPPFNPTAILEYGNPELAVLRRHNENSTYFMAKQSDRWCLLYQDKIAQVWGLKSKFDDPALPSYVPTHQREISERIPQGVAAWPALPRRNDPAASSQTLVQTTSANRSRDGN